MKRIKHKGTEPIYSNPMDGKKIIVVGFDNENDDHYSVVRQFVDGLLKARYAKEAEILDALEEYVDLFR